MKHNFRPYLNPVFIETGTYVGDGVKAALAAGFSRVISIEISNYYFSLTRERFKDTKAELWFGDSLEVLPGILAGINTECTFWLDGHYCGDKTEGKSNPVPLMDELKIIAEHPIKTHTILIDDMRLLRAHDSEWKDLRYGIADLEAFIREINPQYHINYEYGVSENDILIAKV